MQSEAQGEAFIVEQMRGKNTVRCGKGPRLTGRLTEGSGDSESAPSCRMWRHACSRKGVINSDSAVMPAQYTSAAAVMACGGEWDAVWHEISLARDQQALAL